MFEIIYFLREEIIKLSKIKTVSVVRPENLFFTFLLRINFSFLIHASNASKYYENKSSRDSNTDTDVFNNSLKFGGTKKIVRKGILSFVILEDFSTDCWYVKQYEEHFLHLILKKWVAIHINHNFINCDGNWHYYDDNTNTTFLQHLNDNIPDNYYVVGSTFGHGIINVITGYHFDNSCQFFIEQIFLKIN